MSEVEEGRAIPADAAVDPASLMPVAALFRPRWRSFDRGRWVATALFIICVAAQLYLVFSKSFNWDEFLHFSQVHHLRSGTEIEPFQTVHLRGLLWATELPLSLIDQMRAARLFIWLINLFTLAMIFGVARHFADATSAFFAAFAYFAAGYVFVHGFSIRGDPVVTAVLMAALFLMVQAPLTIARSIAIGALVGLAGMITFKAAFYAPCFAGLAWLKFCHTPDRPKLVRRFILIGCVAAASFVAIYLAHTWHFPKAVKPLGKTPFLSFYLRWFTFDMPFLGYARREMLMAPLFFLLALLAPLTWGKRGLGQERPIALAGFLAPLLALLFYRNTFPYFFPFILAPVAVAIAPALGVVRDRLGSIALALILVTAPVALSVKEPRDVIKRQRALIDYVHAEFPHKVGYLEYSGMIADYPRVFKFLTSGNGIRLYNENGDAFIGREIERGNVPFIIADQHTILAALRGRPEPATFLPPDIAAMHGNYVRQWGVLWREGKQVPAGAAPFGFNLSRGGAFVATADLTLDGVSLKRGNSINLAAGPHLVTGVRLSPVVLWRGSALPAQPPALAVDKVFTNF